MLCKAPRHNADTMRTTRHSLPPAHCRKALEISGNRLAENDHTAAEAMATLGQLLLSEGQLEQAIGLPLQSRYRAVTAAVTAAVLAAVSVADTQPLCPYMAHLSLHGRLSSFWSSRSR